MSRRALLPARLPRLTPATITSRSALLQELEAVAREGIAFDREEHSEGICAVGAAVLGPGGPVAALSVPVPAARFASVEQRCAIAVGEAAGEATRLLGGDGGAQPAPAGRNRSTPASSARATRSR